VVLRPPAFFLYLLPASSSYISARLPVPPWILPIPHLYRLCCSTPWHDRLQHGRPIPPLAP